MSRCSTATKFQRRRVNYLVCADRLRCFPWEVWASRPKPPSTLAQKVGKRSGALYDSGIAWALSNRGRMNRLASVLARSPLLLSSKFSRFALAAACLLTGALVLFVATTATQYLLASDLLQSAVAVLAGICAIRATGASEGYLRRHLRRLPPRPGATQMTPVHPKPLLRSHIRAGLMLHACRDFSVFAGYQLAPIFEGSQITSYQ